jgi:hypothetical protein
LSARKDLFGASFSDRGYTGRRARRLSPKKLPSHDSCDTLSKMVVLEKRETRQISFFVRGLKAGGPVDSSNLVNERVNYDEVISVDLASTPQGFQVSASTDRLEVKLFVHEDWRAKDAVDSLDAKLISSIDAERLGAVWIEYREQPTRL